ncbi:MAG: hypothetical protein OXH46_01335 [Gemmatimonadetes bacterium]|nr:hypothetical protein [Gemmatimonadota bacterium]
MAFQSKFARSLRFSVVHCLTLLLPLSVPAGALFPADATAQTASERAAAAASRLEFRELGPAIMGGRVSDLAVVESDPRIFYVGLGAGGVWKTTNDGMTWDPVFDDQPTSSVGAISVAPSNPNHVWVGTGEPANRQSSPWGVGVFKSTDAGGTWMHVGLEDTRHISRIKIDPRDPDVVYVGAVGHLWGPNEERGLFKTVDGGATWENILYIDEHTGIIDLVMDHNDPNTLFAAMYQRQRTGFGFAAGGGGSGLWRTTDGGENWTRLEEGLPEGELGRIGLDIYRRDGNLVYAIVEAHEGQGVYRSTDRGETWEFMSDRNPRPMYFSLIRIDPNNPERIYLGGVQSSASDDGGRTWWPGNATDQIHSDHHALWINPHNSNHLINGNDGGLAFSRDGSVTWRSIRNMPIGQFYEIDVDMSDPYNVCGGLQDNGNWCAPHRTQSTWGVRNREWTHMWFGDGFHNHSDPEDPNIMFSESQGGNMARIDVATREGQSIRPVPRPTGAEAEDEEPRRYRFNWDSPFAISRHDRATIYLGGNHLFRSRDRGMNWEEASPDLTKQIDRDTLEIMGRVVTDETLSDHDGIASYGNITAFAESKHSPDALYVGTDDGNLQVTLDGGATWTNVIDRMPGVPPRTYVSRLETSYAVDGRVYVTFDGHRNDDYAPYAYVSDDHGASWRQITAGLPDGWSVNVIREHPRNPDLLFLGNEIGVYMSIDRGESWARMVNNLPVAAVDDIAIHPRENDLVVGTHGRSIWILDDITPLEEMSADVLAADFRLFGARRGTMWSMGMDWPFQPATFIAPNPPAGIPLRYYVGEGVDAGGASLEVLDGDEVLRTMDVGGDAGVNEVLWDFRVDPAFDAEGGGGGFSRGPPPGAGPRVLPGTYTVRLTVGGESQTTDVGVRLDPRREASRAALVSRQDAMLRAHALAGPARDARERIGAMNDRLAEIRALVDDAEMEDADRERIETIAEAISGQLEEIGDDLGDVAGGAGIGQMEGWSGEPTADQMYRIGLAWEALPEVAERINALLATRMPRLEALLGDLGVTPDLGDPIRIPPRR